MSSSTSIRTVSYSDDFWERFAATAAKHPANLYRYDRIISLLRTVNSGRDCLIDLGCGNGSLLSHVARKLPFTRLIGVDASAEIIGRNQRLVKCAEFFQADLQDRSQFTFENLADVAVCSEVVEHMPDPLPTYPIALKALKPGGYFVLTTQGGKRRRHDIELLGHVRHFDINALAQDVRNAGFEVLAAQKSGWPILDLQKIAASAFMGQVSKQLASANEPSALFRLACWLVGIGLKVSSRSHGPQLFIFARKPVASK